MTRKQTFKQIEIRNRKDRQRNMLAEPGRLDFVIILDQLKVAFSVPKILRSAEAFGAAEILNVSNAASIVMFEYVRQRGERC